MLMDTLAQQDRQTRIAMVEEAVKLAGGKPELLAPLLDVTSRSIRGWQKGGEIKPGNMRRLREYLAKQGRAQVISLETETNDTRVQNVSIKESPENYGSEYLEIPLHEATGSMGGGSNEYGDQIQQHLSFRRDWLRSIHAKPENLFCIFVYGDSMSPTVTDGSVVLVDKGRNIFTNNKVFYIRYEKQMFLKRLSGTERDLNIVSDSDPSHQINVKRGGEFADGDDFEIIGRALWMGRMID